MFMDKRINIKIKILKILSKWIYRFNAMLIKIPAGKKANPKIHMEMQGTLIAKTMLKKNKVGRLTLPYLNTYYKVIGIKTVW